MKERCREILRITDKIFFILLLKFLLFISFTFTYKNIFCEKYFEVIKDDKIDSLSIISIDSIEYVDLNILVNSIDGKIKFKNLQEEITIETDKNYSIILVNSPYIKVGGKIFKIPYTPLFKDDQLFFPFKGIRILLEKLLTQQIEFVENGAKIVKRIKLLKIFEEKNSIKLVFNKTPFVNFELTQRDIILFLKNCYIDEDSFKLKNLKNLIRVAEPIVDKDGATYIITFSPEFIFDTLLIFDDTIKINFIKLSKNEPSKNNSKLNGIRTIIIDPGHGGKDPGAIGKTGTQEKNINLDISLKLEKILSSNFNNIDVVLTRNKDKYLSLKERTNFALKYQNAIFISIHCNASKKQNSSGFETYFLSTAKTDWERAVEARENAAVTFDLPETEKKGIDFIFYDLAQNEFLKQSSRLAELIQMKFENRFNYEKKGVKQAGFYVLKGNFMPAVLIESGYLSNPEEEKKLKSKSYQEEIAKIIFAGIKDFIKEYEKKLSE